jgi:hypothetical protein
MSRRKRHYGKQSEEIQIEWLKHRTGYPSPEEREKIIRMRQELSMELITAMVMGGKPDKAHIQSLIRKYGAEELEKATKKFDATLGQLPAFIADDAKSYRDYRYRYGRFGAGLKFFTAREMDALYETNLKSMKESNDLNRVSELEGLLLFGWREWEDITPPAIPPRPDDFTAPTPASYPAPINELLAWGDELDRSHDFVDETDFMRWRKYIPALTRMALDPGLVNGWPAEKASWAPWHAIHALGALQAWESAPALAEIANFENDWLSDHLPHIWADMGMEVEPSLWMILENASASEKQRGLAAQSLQMMTEDNDAMENKVLNGFEKILKNTKTFNPTVNAYLIHFLRQMEVIDEIDETVQLAFDEERVDLDIITPEDLEESDWDDEFDDDFDDEFDDGEDE